MREEGGREGGSKSSQDGGRRRRMEHIINIEYLLYYTNNGICFDL